MVHPVDVVLVVDRSPSMEGRKMNGAKEAMKMLNSLMSFPRDQLALVSFASTGVLDQPLTTDRSAIDTAIDALTPSNGTNIAEGIMLADREFSSRRHNPDATMIMVVLSDGLSNKGGDPQEAAAAAKSHGVRVIAIGWGHDAEEEVLRAIASSPQDYYFAPEASELTAIYKTIAETMQQCPSPTPSTVNELPATVGDRLP
jgi:Ca-activated chloride channel homolog